MSIKLPKWLNWHNSLILGLGLGAVLGIVIALATGQLKAGIGGGKTEVTSVKTTVGGVETTTTTTPQEAKTLWDWLSLFGVPLTLLLLGYLLEVQQKKRADKQLQEEILQNYFDRVSALLVDKNLLAIAARNDNKPEEKDFKNVSVTVIRAKTLSTLGRLDETQKRSLIRFLVEAGVISQLRLSLKGADLSVADLSGADLSGADLRSVDLRSTKLVGADLSDADLSGADLSRSKLLGTRLTHTNLSNAKLNFAEITSADFSGANLIGADFSGADMIGTDLMLILVTSAPSCINFGTSGKPEGISLSLGKSFSL